MIQSSGTFWTGRFHYMVETRRLLTDDICIVQFTAQRGSHQTFNRCIRSYLENLDSSVILVGGSEIGLEIFLKIIFNKIYNKRIDTLLPSLHEALPERILKWIRTSPGQDWGNIRAMG